MTHRDTESTESNTPSDRGAAGDVSTTGHSGREVDHIDTTRASGTTAGHTAHVTGDDHTHSGGHGHAHDALDDDHNGHGGGGGHGHGDDASEVPTIVPTTWRQLIFPALILLLVGILVWGPVSRAFESRPVSPSTPTEQHGSEGTTEEPGVTGEPTHEAEPHATEETHSPVEVTATSVPNSQQPPTPNPAVIATQTAVGLAAAQGTVARAPVQLQFAGQEFVVKGGSNLLPDWQPPQDQGIATWIEGTYANHILYLPYSEENEALFRNARKGETLKLVMNTGQVFEFEVTRSQRALNGPSTDRTQFTVTTAMAQDHAGVTLFLIGDPAPDRAVVQADFNGNIQ